jgi:hypothetical protein
VVSFFCCKVEKRKRETIPLSPPRRERRNRDFGRKQEEEEERASFLQKGEKNAMLILLTRFFKLSLSLSNI